MSDNRFKDFPTKRIPPVKKEEIDWRKPVVDYEEDADSEYDDYDDDYYDDDYDDYDDYEDAIDDSDSSAYDTRHATRRRDRSLYSPSHRAERRQAQNLHGNRRNTSYANRNRHRKGGILANIKARSKTAFTIIYILILVAAVTTCIIVLYNVFQWIAREAPPPDNLFNREQTERENGNNEDTREPSRPIIQNFSSMITGITTDADSRGLILLDLDTRTTRELPLDDNATLNNRTGGEMTFSQLRIGQLVDVTYDARFPHITTIREIARAWNRDERTNVIINIENQTISVGHEAFLFNSQTLVLHRGEHIPISQIRPADSVSISGVGDIAWLIQLDVLSGSLQIANSDHIINGRISIGNLHPLFLEELTEPIDIPEGPHRIIVEGDNIEDLIETIVIIPNQMFTLNLSNIELNMSTLRITTTPTNANVFINNERITTPNETHIPFGEHTIRVERNGYITHEELITIDESVTTLRFDLEAESLEATLTISTTPLNAEIFVNGIHRGRANPNIVLVLDPGMHQIAARLDGFYEELMYFTLIQRQEVSQTITLRPITVPDVNIDDPPDNNQGGNQDNNQGPGNGLLLPPPPPPAP